MSVDEDDDRLVYVPLEELITPPNHSGDLRHAYRAYWCVHPTRGAVFWRTGRGRYAHLSAQCNPHELVSTKVGRMYPWAEIRLIEHAFWRSEPPF